MSRLFSIVLCCICFSSCIETQNNFTKLPPGNWRAALYLNGTSLPIATDDETNQINDIEGELPFNFEVVYIDENSFKINIINGDEVIEITDIEYGLDRATAKDTIVINFAEFDTYIKAIYEEGIMEGDWYVNYKENYKIPFKAYHGHKNRFPLKNEKPLFDINGNWATLFEFGTEDEYPAIGQFIQKDQHLSGTFTTETGDYRYLDGIIYDDKIKLSTFDGSHAFLFEGKVVNNDSIIGIFKSGKHYTTNWSAKKTKNQQFLKSPYELTKDISQNEISFTLLNDNGDSISLNDSKYVGKYKLLQIMGTWCPNCKDETQFLTNFYSKKPQNLEIISIGFERYKDPTKSLEILQKYKGKLDIPYEVLLGGYYDKQEVLKIFPQLDKVYSYPTLLYLDKQNKIKNIYTGFYGPATQEHEKFIKEFYTNIENLINDK